MAFSKILIANRGEIAVRVMRTAAAMGYRTVAVFSAADRGAPHVEAADEAVCIGAGPVGDSYLNSAAILAAAQRTGAEAIHPGYGFFSENADFARACIAAGLVFIGPDPDAIDVMGNKCLARARIIAAGVPCATGYEGDNQDATWLGQEAERIGYPVMIKAAAGGGGRGMRLVNQAHQFADALAQAQAEALSAFGNGVVLLEKALVNVRHVEVQVFGDRHGTMLHLGERDCSVQRRHQKVIEEAPSPAVDAELRQRMGAAAVAAARSVNYVGAGTVEFLLDASGHFYFMEMNTRLQVEHPVTELVTGLDLVEWQLRVAAGEALPLTQDQVILHGHAIEVRLYAEDPSADYLPQTGRIVAWRPAQGVGVRIDSGISEGQEISSHYDPMLAKVIAVGCDRDEALRRLCRALQDTRLMGVVSNREFLLNILRDPTFASGGATTTLLQERAQSFITTQEDSTALALASILLSGQVLSVQLLSGHSSSGHSSSGQSSTRQAFENAPATAGTSSGGNGWRSTGVLSWPVKMQVGDGEPGTVSIVQDGLMYTVMLPSGDVHELALARMPVGDTGPVDFSEGGHLRRGYYGFLDDGRLALDLSGATAYYRSLGFSERRTAAVADGQLNAPMSGKIVEVSVSPGDTVHQGQVLVTLEAMKMFHQLVAAFDGTVEAVDVALEQQVDIGSPLVTVASQPPSFAPD